MALSLDDYEQNAEMMKAGENLANDLSELIKRAYPNKCMRFKAILRGRNEVLFRKLISEALIFKINELLQVGNSGKELFIPQECSEMIEDIFALIKGNYNNKPEKLREYVSVLSDEDGRNEFMFQLGYILK